MLGLGDRAPAMELLTRRAASDGHTDRRGVVSRDVAAGGDQAVTTGPR